MKALLIFLLGMPLFALSQTDTTKVYANDIYHEYTIGGSHQVVPGKLNAVDMYCGNLRVKMTEGPVKLRISCGSTLNDKTSPLFVINDCIIENYKLTNLNPADIKSISIFKNATAIEKYGQQGKNGVIYITLKNDAVMPVTNVSALTPVPKP